jgi:hypothetical protein
MRGTKSLQDYSYALERRLGGPQIPSGRGVKGKILNVLALFNNNFKPYELYSVEYKDD